MYRKLVGGVLYIAESLGGGWWSEAGRQQLTFQSQCCSQYLQYIDPTPPPPPPPTTSNTSRPVPVQPLYCTVHYNRTVYTQHLYTIILNCTLLYTQFSLLQLYTLKYICSFHCTVYTLLTTIEQLVYTVQCTQLCTRDTITYIYIIHTHYPCPIHFPLQCTFCTQHTLYIVHLVLYCTLYTLYTVHLIL